jgi:cyclin T
MKPSPTPMDKQQIKLAAAPVPTDRRRIVSAPVPVLRHTQSSRRSFSNSNSNTEVSSCVTTSSSFNKNSTSRSPRNEGNWYRGKNEENPYWRRHINHNLEQRLEERSNQRTLKSDLAYLVRPKDTNATEIKNLTRQKRRIQEVGGLPTPVYMSDTNAWRQVSGVIVFETTSSRQKQKVERR